MKKFALLLIVLALIALPAVADTASMQFLGGGPGSHGEQVYPYSFNVNNSPMALTCVNIDRSISAGETWLAQVLTLNDISDPVLKNKYLEAGFLINQYGQKDAGLISWAVWSVFAPTDPHVTGLSSDPTFQGDVINLVALADAFLTNSGQASLRGYLETHLRIYEPIAGTQSGDLGLPQNFETVVPEPGTLMLFGTGLLSAVGVLRRRFSI